MDKAAAPKYRVVQTKAFRKGYKLLQKQHKDMTKLDDVVHMLSFGIPLPERCRDHTLTGNWRSHRECHIEPDWVMIYSTEDDILILTLVRTGTHSEVLKL